MSDRTHIEWADATWNPIRARRRDGQPNKADGGWACQRVSAGCQNCYAAGINKRRGTGFDYDAKGVAASDIYLDEQALTRPLHWRRPRRIFVCSMTDLFGEWVPDEMIDRVFAVMALSPQHTFQVLTKRPGRMRAYLSGARWQAVNGAIWARSGYETPGALEPLEMTWPLPNVWLGTSVEDQERADQRYQPMRDLAQAGWFTWVSAEPLLSDVNVMPWLRFAVGWLVVGGESGPGARPFDIAWARSTVAQCRVADVAVFVKQLGAKPFEVLHEMRAPGPGAPVGLIGRTVPVEVPLKLKSRKGGDMEEWPEDLRVREFPEVRHD